MIIGGNGRSLYVSVLKKKKEFVLSIQSIINNNGKVRISLFLMEYTYYIKIVQVQFTYSPENSDELTLFRLILIRKLVIFSII